MSSSCNFYLRIMRRKAWLTLVVRIWGWWLLLDDAIEWILYEGENPRFWKWEPCLSRKSTTLCVVLLSNWTCLCLFGFYAMWLYPLIMFRTYHPLTHALTRNLILKRSADWRIVLIGISMKRAAITSLFCIYHNTVWFTISMHIQNFRFVDLVIASRQGNVIVCTERQYTWSIHVICSFESSCRPYENVG